MKPKFVNQQIRTVSLNTHLMQSLNHWRGGGKICIGVTEPLGNEEIKTSTTFLLKFNPRTSFLVDWGG